MEDNSVTFETKCFEGDWEVILKTGYLEKQIENLDYGFDKKILYINNVDDLREVEKYAHEKKAAGVIDDYICVKDFADEAMDAFGLSREQFGRGYYYSIAEIVGIYLCSSKYLFHFSGDSRLERKYKKNFVREALKYLEDNPDTAVANPVWNYQFKGAKKESDGCRGDFLTGYGFSDQCYLIRACEFKKDVYHYHHEDSNRYPDYAGELFEKRMDSYMRVNKRKRATYMPVTYIEDNIRDIISFKKENTFPRKQFRTLRMICGKV